MENRENEWKKHFFVYNRFDMAEVNTPDPSSYKSFACPESQS